MVDRDYRELNEMANKIKSNALQVLHVSNNNICSTDVAVERRAYRRPHQTINSVY